jgi:hypothetical protein
MGCALRMQFSVPGAKGTAGSNGLSAVPRGATRLRPHPSIPRLATEDSDLPVRMPFPGAQEGFWRPPRPCRYSWAIATRSQK